MEIINLLPEDYYTQINNLKKPLVACMPTARVMFYKGNKIPFNYPKGKQPEDYFMELLNTPAAIKFARKKYPDIDLPPNQIHGMYGTYLDPIVVGRRTSDFTTDLTIDGIKKLLDEGQVIMTSGRFSVRIDGHAFVIIGYYDNGFYLGDPFGDFRDGYKTRGKGYKIPMTFDEYRKIGKPINSVGKWGHVTI